MKLHIYVRKDGLNSPWFQHICYTIVTIYGAQMAIRVSQIAGIIPKNVFESCTLYNFTKILGFPRQSLKRFTFRVKSRDSKFFLLGLSPVVN